jgi:hypothetical protein
VEEPSGNRTDAGNIPDSTATPIGEEGLWKPDPTPPLMDQVWQPPEPKKRFVAAEPTAVIDSPDVLLLYEFANVGISGAYKFTADGRVVQRGFQGRYITYNLSPDEFGQLKEQIARVGFFNLSDRYWEEDPPGVIAERTIITLAYREGDRTKSVTIRGTEETPTELGVLMRMVDGLIERAVAAGTRAPRPAQLVDFYLQGTDYTWWLNIDVEGNLYYSAGPAEVRMSDGDLQALNSTLEGISGLGGDVWFTAPDKVRDVIYRSEHRAIITTYRNGEQYQWINALSGGRVPAGLQAVLEKLAELYDEYAPTQ